MAIANQPLNAQALSAGSLFNTTLFTLPRFQREYAWETEEVQQFLNDLLANMERPAYFIGLVILYSSEDGEAERYHIVDGQQRLLTLSLLAQALYVEARSLGRHALAERLDADFLNAVDYETDEKRPRLLLADPRDREDLRVIVEFMGRADDGEALLARIQDHADRLGRTSQVLGAFLTILKGLRYDLDQHDAFKRLGSWTSMITQRVQLAVFLHPDPSSAYRVFEVINDRGKSLTPAHLLKNYVLAHTPEEAQEDVYERWQAVADEFRDDADNAFVQYIQHAIATQAGYVAPRDLYDFLSREAPAGLDAARSAPPIDTLVGLLEMYLPLYRQMVDPTRDGPGSVTQVEVYAALADLGIISVRPLLLSLASQTDADTGAREVLRLVVRRLVVSNVAAGSVEKRFGDAALKVALDGVWPPALESLTDLDAPKDDFIQQISRRPFNSRVRRFLWRSVVQGTETPTATGNLQLVRPRSAEAWDEFDGKEFKSWGTTIGNSIIAELPRRPHGAGSWPGFKSELLPHVLGAELLDEALSRNDWTPVEVEMVGRKFAQRAADLWYRAHASRS
jgi:hypothetical protein